MIPERRACHPRVTFAVRDGISLPCLIDRSGAFGETIYASPTADGHGFAIGLAGSGGGVPVDENGTASGDSDLASIRERIEAYARRALPDALGEPRSTRLCITTPLVQGGDAFAAWRHGNLTFFAGGNLFKFAPVIARLLADATGGNAVPTILRPSPS
jgi:sarcosine oxidase